MTPIKLAGLELNIGEEVINKIYQLTTGHPFFIHFIMRELVSLKKRGKVNLDYFNTNYPIIEKIIEREKFTVDFSIV